MAWLVDILKSKGKLGASFLMVLGLGHMVYVFFQGAAMLGGYEVGGGMFLAGLSLFGIRSYQEKQGQPPV